MFLYASELVHSTLGQRTNVPKTLPYASGHGSRVTVPSAAVVDEQVPSRYMASKIFGNYKPVFGEQEGDFSYSISGGKGRKAVP